MSFLLQDTLIRGLQRDEAINPTKTPDVHLCMQQVTVSQKTHNINSTYFLLFLNQQEDIT
jgi:hypothetical protein